VSLGVEDPLQGVQDEAQAKLEVRFFIVAWLRDERSMNDNAFAVFSFARRLKPQ